MKNAIAISPCINSGVAAAPPFNPATLPLSGWWRSDFSASPWAGTASAGGSSGRDLTEATNPPTTGTAVNGRTPARFNGTTTLISIATSLATLLTTTAYTAIVLLNPSAIGGVASPAGAHILSDTTNWWGVGMWLNTTNRYFAYHFDSANRVAEAPASSAAVGRYDMVHTRLGGNNLECGTNGIWGTATVVNALGGGGNFRAGRGPSVFLGADVLEIMLAPSSLSNTDIANIKSYFNARYALAL